VGRRAKARGELKSLRRCRLPRRDAGLAWVVEGAPKKTRASKKHNPKST